MCSFVQYKNWVQQKEKEYAEYACKSTSMIFLDGTTFDDYYSSLFGCKDEFIKKRNMYRTPFKLEADRILYSNLFERLLGKTQLFTANNKYQSETRYTHTLKVLQISKCISRGLKLNDDLVEAISLGHDLGHPPFAHIGEKAINSWLSESLRQFEENPGLFEPEEPYIIWDYNQKAKNNILKYYTIANCGNEKLFMHGRQSFRLLVFKRKEYKNEILRFSKQAIYGIWKHSTKDFEFDKDFKFTKDIFFKNKQNEPKQIALEGENCVTFENQVVRYADDIAWTTSDIIEGINYKILARNDITELIDRIEDRDLQNKVLQIFSFDNPRIPELLTIFICDLIENNLPYLEQNHPNPIEYQISLSPAVNDLFKLIRELVYKKIHERYFVARGSIINSERIKALCSYYFDNLEDFKIDFINLSKKSNFPIKIEFLNEKSYIFNDFDIINQLMIDDPIYKAICIIDFVSCLTDIEIHDLSETFPIKNDF